MLSAAIVGASGYTGGELLRLLDGHPRIEVRQATSERLAGRPVDSAHPNLRGRGGPTFRRADELEPADVVFLCLPHGQSSERIEALAPLAGTLVDLSADFRLRDPERQQRWVGPDAAPGWRRRFVYGLPESRRGELAGARLISGVGCNATAMILALLPLARAGWIERVVADLKVGSSEAGAGSSESSHHPERSRAMRTFAPVGHRHQAEVCEQLDLSEDAVFVTVTAVEAVRGVLATCHVFLDAGAAVDEKAVWRLYRETYAGEPFVRLVNQRRGLHRLPDPKVLLGSNYCDVGFRLDGRGRRLVALAAIDNLVKGAAGSALQSLNVARGFAENEGLDFPGLHPV